MFFARVLQLNFVILLFLTIPTYASSNNISKGINIETSMIEAVKNHSEIKWVSVADIKKSLPKTPINVGFDLDDTVFYTSACFYKATNDLIKEKNLKYLPTEALKIDADKKLWKAISTNQEFWDKIASCNAEYAIPKQVSLELIKMHQKRGDKIFFITARKAPSTQEIAQKVNEAIKVLLNSNAGLQAVQYSNIASKTPLIKQDKLDIYYGDANSDITDAKAANVRAIRILRSEASTYLPIPLNGQFKEEVVIGSYR